MDWSGVDIKTAEFDTLTIGNVPSTEDVNCHFTYLKIYEGVWKFNKITKALGLDHKAKNSRIYKVEPVYTSIGETE